MSERRFWRQAQAAVKASEQKERPQEKHTQAPPSASPKSSKDEGVDPLVHLRQRVLKPIQERIYLPINRLIDKLGWVSATLLLVGITGTAALAVRMWSNPDEGRRAITVARFYLEARKPTPPQDPKTEEVIRDLTNRLKDEISPSNRGRSELYGPWAEGQMAVSLQGKDALDEAEMAQWFISREGTCHCWRDNLSDPVGNFGTTGWVLLALARMKAKPTEQELAFVLDNQRRPGWWSIYPTASDDPNNASTYATALSIWALQELLNRNLIADTQKQHATEAIRRGRSWLLDNAIPGRPGRWKDYPHGDVRYGAESIGLSGVALHALHRTPGPPPSANDADWMLNLPVELPGLKDEFSSGQSIRFAGPGFYADSTHHFAFPWLIIATTDAYSQGSLTERAQAARLFHQIPERRQALNDFKNMPFFVAETLIALRHLQGDDVI